MSDRPLPGETLFITGASRGIGEAIALRVARDGANIVETAKTAEPHARLGGTIHTATAEIEADPELAAYPARERVRVAAFRPGGEWARVLSTHNLAMQVGDTVFVHGGLPPAHARAGIEAIHADVRAWMRGEAAAPERWLDGDGPVWTRAYSDDDTPADCDSLTEALDTQGAARMVVGHTVQDEANPACDGRVWRMDVGMAAHYGGRPAALVLTAGDARLLEGD